jgi:hypothetical protein
MISWSSVLLADLARAAGPDALNPLAARPPHHSAMAKRLIFLCMSGAPPSQVDLFDPKPALARHRGKPLPFEQPRPVLTRTTNILQSPFKFQRHGQSGAEVGELLPHVAGCVDDLCMIRSVVADYIAHSSGVGWPHSR